MDTDDFFQEIEHTPVPWRQRQLFVPIFYPSIMFMTAAFLVPIAKMRTLLPSKRLKPYRITPWHSIFSIALYRYHESDLGPYNEVLLGVPVTIDEETPLFTGSLRKLPAEPMTLIQHLPVTTEIAREVGAEFAGYPKFLADIEFAEEGDWITCELRANNQRILTLKGRKLDLAQCPRFRVYPLTYRRGYILRSELIISERKMGTSKRREDVELVLGEHTIAEELKAMNLGKLASYSYCPQAQGILTPVIESFAG